MLIYTILWNSSIQKLTLTFHKAVLISVQGVVGSLMTLLQICSWVYQWKNVENRPIFDAVIIKTLHHSVNRSFFIISGAPLVARKGLQTFGRQDVWATDFLDDHLGDTGWTFRRQQLDVWAAMNICSGKEFSSRKSTSKTLQSLPVGDGASTNLA